MGDNLVTKVPQVRAFPLAFGVAEERAKGGHGGCQDGTEETVMLLLLRKISLIHDRMNLESKMIINARMSL